MATPEKNTDAVYDASTLGTPKMLVLGLQHLFAMFGATVLVPAITGLNVSTTLLFAGLGTLLFPLGRFPHSSDPPSRFWVLTVWSPLPDRTFR